MKAVECEHPPHSTPSLWHSQVRLIGFVDPVDRGFQKKGNSISCLHFYSIDGDVVSRIISSVWYCLPSSWYMYLSTPPRPRLSGTAHDPPRRVGHRWYYSSSGISYILLSIQCWLCYRLVCYYSGHTPLRFSRALFCCAYVVNSLYSRAAVRGGSAWGGGRGGAHWA